MKSLYAQYREEREGAAVIEDEYGFASCIFGDDHAYIDEIFVVKEKRKEGHASKYADKIALMAKERGLNKLYGSVCTEAKGATASVKVLLAYGFKLSHCEENMIYFIKEIK